MPSNGRCNPCGQADSLLFINCQLCNGIIIIKLTMSFLICHKHNKYEKNGNKVAVNAYVCMNRYCPDSFKVFCSACKNDHRDHAMKILTIEDITFLVDRLLKAPFKQATRYIDEAVDVMRKLKLIKQFRKKIDILQKQIQKEALKLIENTEILIEEYGICKDSITGLSQYMAHLELPKNYDYFYENSKEILSNLDYDFKKDKFGYGNTLIRERQDKRGKSLENSKRKIEQLKDYSMKIIQVILHNEDSEQDEENDVVFKKKYYEILKKEVSQDKDETQLESEISELKNSKSTSRSHIKRSFQTTESQTNSDLLSREEMASELQFKINDIKIQSQRTQNDLRLKIGVMAKEKENMNRELNKMKEKYQQKKKKILQAQALLMSNMKRRVQKQKEREVLFQKIMQVSQWKGLTIEDRYE